MKFKYVLDGDMDRKNAHTVEGALGRRKKLDFPYNSQASLDEALKTMSLFDMQDLGIKLAVKPMNNRHRLKKVISEKFCSLRKSYGSAIALPEIPQEKEEFDPKKYE